MKIILQIYLFLIGLYLILGLVGCTSLIHMQPLTEIPDPITPLSTSFEEPSATLPQAPQYNLIATSQMTSVPYPEDRPISPPSEAITVDNASQLQLLGQLSNGRVQKSVITPDGKQLAVISTNGVYIYKLETLEEHQLELDPSVNDVAFDPTGGLLAVASNTSLHVWDMATGQLLHDLDVQGPVFSVNFDSEGNRLVSGGKYIIHIWDVRSGNLLQQITTENGQVLTVAFHPEGTLLVSGGSYSEFSPDYPTLQLWNLNNGQVIHNLDQTREYHRAVFSPDGSLIVASNSSMPRLWETNSGKLLGTLQPYPSRFNFVPKNLVFGTDGKTIIGDGGLIQQWNLQGELINVWGGKILSSYNLERQKLVIQYDTSFEIMDLNTEQVERVFALPKHLGEITNLAFSPDHSRIATTSDDGIIRIWNVKSGQLELSRVTGYDNLTLVAFHPNGEILAYGGCKSETFIHVTYFCDAGEVILWDLEEDEVIFQNSSLVDVIKIAFSSDGQYLAINAWSWSSRVLQQYNLVSGNSPWLMEGCNEFAFNPNGRLIAADCDNRIKLVDTYTGNILQEFTHGGHDPILTFSPDGKLLASSSGPTGAIQIWELSENSEKIPIMEIYGQITKSGYVSDMAFSLDGQLLILAVGYGELQLFDISDDELLFEIDTPVVQIELSSDDMMLATSDGGDVKIWGIR